MKFTINPQCALLIASAIFSTAQIAPANTELWTPAGVDTNWSNTANWTQIGAGGAGPNGNDTVFGNTGAAGIPGTITSVVDQSGLNPYTLTFTNGAGFTHTVLIPTGVTMTDANNFTNGFLAPASAAYYITNAITGGGEFDVDGTVQIGLERGSGIAILDMSGLSTFKQTNSSGQFYIGIHHQLIHVIWPPIHIITSTLSG